MSKRKLLQLLVVAMMVVALVAPATTAGAVPGPPVQLSFFCDGVQYDATNPAHELHPTAAGATFVDGALNPDLPLNVLYLVVDRSDATGDTWTFIDSTMFSAYPSWGGHVYFTGSGYDDTACLGFGSDVAMGFGGDDLLAGEWGDGDRLYGGTGKDTLHTGFTFTDIAEGLAPLEPPEFPPTDERASVDDPDLFVDIASGGADDDVIVGGGGFAGEQLLQGGAGDDEIWGGGGRDVIRANKGDDKVYTGIPYEFLLAGQGPIYTWFFAFGGPFDGPDARQLPLLDSWIFGGDGDDMIFSNACSTEIFGFSSFIFGNKGNDTIVGQPWYEDWTFFFDGLPIGLDPDGGCEEFINGGPDDDNIWGGGDEDNLKGAGGADVIYADSPSGTVPTDARGFTQDASDDVLFGNAGADKLFGDFGYDGMYGGDGDDELSGSSGGDYLNGGKGADTLIGGKGRDTLEGKAGNDLLYSDTAAAASDDARACSGDTSGGFLYGGPGDDMLLADCFKNLMFGGGGVDTITGLDGDDEVNAGPGDDVVDTGKGDDEVDGNDDDDAIVTGDGDDTVDGGKGDDTISTGKGDDTAVGGDGDDTIDGGDGDDTLQGQKGDDYVVGGADDDRLTGGDGADILEGGTGNDDLFHFDYNALYSNIPDGDADMTYGGTGNDDSLGGCGDLDWFFEGKDLEQFVAGGFDRVKWHDHWTASWVEIVVAACPLLP